MFSLLIFVFFGLIVGLIAKALHPGNEPAGFFQTVGIGIAGSFVGGLINWLIGAGGEPFAMSGFVMSIVGGIICCAAWRWYVLKNSSEGPKSFLSGKRLK